MDSNLDGVAALSPRNVWVVGTFGVEHYTGRWQLASKDSSYGAITATGSSDLWAVGGRHFGHYACR